MRRGRTFRFRPARRAGPDVVLDDLAVYLRHLFERQFACQHHRVGPLREELHGFGIRNVALGRNMHFDPDAPGVEYRREIGGDDGVNAFGLGAVDYLVDGLHLVLVDDGVDREVGLDPCGVCRGDDLRQVVEREIRSRRRAHVELPDAEIYRVRPGLYGCGQCFVRPYGGHDFYLGALHSVVYGGCPCEGCFRNQFLRPIRLRAYSRIRSVRDFSTERVSRMPSALSKRSEICCSVRRGMSRRS